MSAMPEGSEADIDPTAAAPTEPSLSTRLAFWAFCAYLAVAAVLLLAVIGHHRWFWVDEWDFLAGRQLTVDGLFHPFDQHWSTVPVLVYRVLFGIFGVSTYVPYQATLVALHLTVAALLRVIMRRVGVGPWLATVAAGVLVLFGPGYDDIIAAFNISFDTAVVLGLTQLLLADHDGPIDRRDSLGLVAGAVALMSTGVAIPLIVATGIVTLWRRGLRAAAFHTVPLGVAYGVWYVATDASLSASMTEFSHGTITGVGRASIGEIVRWTVNGTKAAFSGLGQHWVLAVLFVAMLVVGLPLAWARLTRRELATRAAIPAALLVAWVVLMMSSALNRFAVLGVDGARGGRYVYIYAALLLPALAVAGNALIKQWKVVTPAVFALFLIPIPWQVRDFKAGYTNNENYFNSLKAEVVDLANSPLVEQVPAWVRPDARTFALAPVDAGWLIDQRDRGKLPPRPGRVPPTSPDTLRLRFGVSQTDQNLPADITCQDRSEPLVLQPAVGDELIIDSPVTVTLVDDSGATLAGPITFNSWDGPVVSVQLPDLRIVVDKPAGAKTFTTCERST